MFQADDIRPAALDGSGAVDGGDDMVVDAALGNAKMISAGEGYFADIGLCSMVAETALDKTTAVRALVVGPVDADMNIERVRKRVQLYVAGRCTEWSRQIKASNGDT